MGESQESAECRKIGHPARFPSRRYDSSGGSGKILRASNSEDNSVEIAKNDPFGAGVEWIIR